MLQCNHLNNLLTILIYSLIKICLGFYTLFLLISRYFLNYAPQAGIVYIYLLNSKLTCGTSINGRQLC